MKKVLIIIFSTLIFIVGCSHEGIDINDKSNEQSDVNQEAIPDNADKDNDNKKDYSAKKKELEYFKAMRAVLEVFSGEMHTINEELGRMMNSDDSLYLDSEWQNEMLGSFTKIQMLSFTLEELNNINGVPAKYADEHDSIKNSLDTIYGTGAYMVDKFKSDSNVDVVIEEGVIFIQMAMDSATYAGEKMISKYNEN